MNGSGSLDFDENGSHVIAANSRHGVLGYELIQKFPHDLFIRLRVLQMAFNNIYQSLAIIYVSLPYSVTTYYYKLVCLMPLKRTNVRFARNHLLVVSQLFFAFVVKVTKGTTQVQTPVHATHVYYASSVFYTTLLLLTLRLVIQRQIYRLASPTQRTPRVTSVSYDILSRSNQHDIGSAACRLGDRLTLRHIAISV